MKTDCFATLLALQFNDNRKSCDRNISDMASVKQVLGKAIYGQRFGCDSFQMTNRTSTQLWCPAWHAIKITHTDNDIIKKDEWCFLHLPCHHPGSSQAWNCAVLSHMRHCVLLFYTCFPWRLSCETFLPQAHISSHILPTVKTYLLQVQWRYIAFEEYENKQ